MVGCALLLVALQTAWTQLRQGNTTDVTGWLPYALCMTLAAFFFDVFVVYSFLLAVYFWVGLRRRDLRPSPSELEDGAIAQTKRATILCMVLPRRWRPGWLAQ